MEASPIEKKFEGLKEGEKMILWIDKHWMVRVRVFFIGILLIILPAILGFPLINWMAGNNGSFSIGMAFLFVYELFALLYIFIQLLNEELDIFVITNQRIIDIDQVNLIQRKITDTPIINVQDVTCECKGLLATLFKYGRITVKTAAAQGSQLSMRFVPEAFDRAKVMLDLVHSIQDKKPGKTPEQENPESQRILEESENTDTGSPTEDIPTGRD